MDSFLQNSAMRCFKNSKNRLSEIDFLRGIAILMMFVFHFMWDLDYFGAAGTSLYSGFWGVFQKLTGGLFIFLAGLSLTLSYWHGGHKNYPSKYLLRGLKIFGCGMIITIGSLIFARHEFVFFGILHFIGAAIILATPFIRFSWLNLLLGIITLASGIWLQKFTFSFPWLVWLGLQHPISTLDLYPILPWIGVFFIGIFFGNMVYPKGKRRIKVSLSIPQAIARPLQFLGRHSLLMYFAHLPVAFAIAFIVSLM